LAAGAGAFAALAATLSIVGIWTDPEGDAFIKAIAALWILAVLGWLLVPVLQRFSSVGAEEAAVRVLAELDGVEIVASRGSVKGIRVDAPSSGERLFLRRRH
jgi:hypothetical protein